MTLLKAVVMDDRFVGYQPVTKFNLRAADCLCYKWFPSLQDIIFNHRKITEYALLGFLRKGLNSQTDGSKFLSNPTKYLLFPNI